LPAWLASAAPSKIKRYLHDQYDKQEQRILIWHNPKPRTLRT